jgi:hypothetical protein
MVSTVFNLGEDFQFYDNLKILLSPLFSLAPYLGCWLGLRRPLTNRVARLFKLIKDLYLEIVNKSQPIVWKEIQQMRALCTGVS